MSRIDINFFSSFILRVKILARIQRINQDTNKVAVTGATFKGQIQIKER